jgi:DNA-binding MarR family transcriptional regulator
MKAKGRPSRRRPSGPAGLNGQGVLEALLAALRTLYSEFPSLTFPQYLVALEVLAAERRGTPHTLTSLSRALNMPNSTASRVVWTLTEQGGTVGALKYEGHPEDRRRKYITVEEGAMGKIVPKVLTRTLREHYANSGSNAALRKAAASRKHG